MSRSTKSRRDFLRNSAGVAAAGIAIPYVLSDIRAWAGSPNSRPSVAAIGVGGRGSDIGHQAAEFAAMVACCDVDRGNANRFAEACAKRNRPKPEVYTDYRKVLERKDVDVVTIGTPDHWHTKIAIEAMRAGKDVYCEKPLTLTMQESQWIAQVVKQTGRVFQVGTQQRSEYTYDESKGPGRKKGVPDSPPPKRRPRVHQFVFLRAVVLARSGRLGKTLRAISSVGGATSGGPFATMPPPPDLDWDFWLGQAPQVDYSPERRGWNFRWWFDYSGGQVTDWGVHHTDIALWALGGEQTGVVEAQGQGDFPLGRETMLQYLLGKKSVKELPNSYNVARSFDCTLTLPNGNTIRLTSGPNELILEGENGRIRVNRGSLQGKPIEELTDADMKWLDEEVRKLYRGKEPGHHMRNFFECVQDRSLPISDVFTHVNSVNACHMANIAMLVGRKVRFDPAQQSFVADEQANALMRRRQRPPYTITV